MDEVMETEAEREMAAQREAAPVQSPPPSGAPVHEPAEPEARRRLHELAMQLRQTCNRQALMEYLRLRRRR
jgi:hypothetical protein